MKFPIEGEQRGSVVPVQQEAAGPLTSDVDLDVNNIINVGHRVTHGLTWRDMNPDEGKFPSRVPDTSPDSDLDLRGERTWRDLTPEARRLASSLTPDADPDSGSGINPLRPIGWRELNPGK